MKWWIRLLGSSSVLAETGDGTGKPRELYLCMISRRLFERYLRNSIFLFHTWPFAVESLSDSERMQAIKVFSHLKLFCQRTHARNLYQPQFASTVHGSLPSELPCHLPLNAKCASSVFPRSWSTSRRTTTNDFSALSVADGATTLTTDM